MTIEEMEKEKRYKNLYDSYKGEVEKGKVLESFDNVKESSTYDEGYMKYLHERLYLVEKEFEHSNSLFKQIQENVEGIKNQYDKVVAYNYRLTNSIKELDEFVREFQDNFHKQIDLYIENKMYKAVGKPRVQKSLNDLKEDLYQIVVRPYLEIDSSCWDDLINPVLAYLEDYVRDMDTRIPY